MAKRTFFSNFAVQTLFHCRDQEDAEYYARLVGHNTVQSKTKSRKRMIMDLKQRGIEFDASSNVYDELLEKNDIDNEETIILEFLTKKGFAPDSATYEEKQKMTQTLLRKGFSFDSIHNILGYFPFS